MSSAITIEGQKRISQLMGSEQPLIIDMMVLAMVPDLDLTQPVDRSQQMPDPAHIVHTQTIDADHKGYVDPDQVIFSIMMGSDVGDFSFNWIGTLEKDTDRVITVTITPETPKRKTNLPQNTTGNCITRNVILAFQNAQALTGITISAETWQFDYESRFNNHAERLVDPTKTGTEKAHMTNDQAKAWNDKLLSYDTRFNGLSLIKEFEPNKVLLELFATGQTLYKTTTWTVDLAVGKALANNGESYQATGLVVGNLNKDKAAVVRRTDNDAVITAFFRDAAHTDWTPAPWAWRRDAGNGFVDVEYQIPARGTFDFKIDSTAGHSAVDPTIDHIVFVECESGLWGTHRPPVKPSIISPSNGATEVGEQPSLTTSAFSHPVGDNLQGTQFQISNNADFAADHIIKDSGVVSGISWSPDKGVLSTNTIYHVRAKHLDVQGGQSDWSEAVSYTTKSNFVTVNKPTCMSPAASEELSSPDGLTLVSSNFSTEGGSDTHASSRWQVARDPAFTSIVHDSNETTSNKTSYNVPDGIVERGKTYYWRVMHKGATKGYSDWSNGTVFSILSIANGVRVDGGIAVGPYTFADGQDGYIIVAPASQRQLSLKWGFYIRELPEIDNPSSSGTDSHTGIYNTGILTSPPYNTYSDNYGVVGSPAANFCVELTFENQNDFFLPNKEELSAVIMAKDAIDAVDETTGLTFLEIGDNEVWSSTESASDGAWVQTVSSSSPKGSGKINSEVVIPCRRVII